MPVQGLGLAFLPRDFLLEQLLLGRFFSTGERFVDVNGATHEFVVENPANSGIILLIGFTVRASGGAIVGKDSRVTIDSSGTTLTVTDKDSNLSTAEATAERDGTYSSPDASFNDKQLGGGTNPSSISPGTFDGGTANSVRPGHNILLRVTDDSGTSTADLSVDIDWIEYPLAEAGL